MRPAAVSNGFAAVSEPPRDDRTVPLAVRRVLVPLDTSAFAERAVDIALNVASACGADVDLLTVIDPDAGSHGPFDPLDWEEERAEARAYLSRVARRFEDRGVTVRACTADGPAAEEILRVAGAAGTNLILMATHGAGRGTQWPVGSTARKVVERTPCSVLLVPSEWEPHGPLRRVLVPVDSSHRSECALPLATRLAAAGEGTLVLAHVVPVPEISTQTLPSEEERELVERLTRRNQAYARDYMARLRDRLLNEVADVDIVSGASPSPAMSLLELADESGADLIVLSAHGNNNDPACRYGSVAAQLIANPRCPTLVVMDGPRRGRPTRWSGAPVAVRERVGRPYANGDRH